MDPPDGDEMQRAPLPRADPLFDSSVLWRMALMTPLATAVTFAGAAAML